MHPKINGLAVAFGKLINTKSTLKHLINTSAEIVKFLPADNPTPLTEAVRTGSAHTLPSNVTVTVHSPTNRKWSATITRSESGVFSVK